MPPQFRCAKSDRDELGCAVRFAKYHGLGNDYLVIEPSELEPARALALAPRICDRNRGLGSDGILLGPLPSSSAQARLRIINPDGSEAEKSGNGLRIFARYLWDTAQARGAEFSIETAGGVAPVTIGARAEWIEVGMGKPDFNSKAVGLQGPNRPMVGGALLVGDIELSVVTVSVGNPHCVVLEQPVTPARARELGPRIEHSGLFAERTNVQLLEVLARDTIRIEIWERGAGYTLASGSSASAAASAAQALGLCDAEVTVQMPGGQLHVRRSRDGTLFQRGPVTRIAEGTLCAEALTEHETCQP